MIQGFLVHARNVTIFICLVRGHIIWDGFMSKYKNWTQHGEPQLSLYANQDIDVTSDSIVGDDMIGMIHDAKQMIY
jgi:hypothetical protein